MRLPTPPARTSDTADLPKDLAGDFSDAPLRMLEDDENVPPRPEEELADLERSAPEPKRQAD